MCKATGWLLTWALERLLGPESAHGHLAGPAVEAAIQTDGGDW